MKKVTCVLLGFCLALSVFLSGGIELDMTTVHASDSVLGDITGDDAVTSDDTAALEQYLVGNATANEDVNGDGTSADVRDLVRYERYCYIVDDIAETTGLTGSGTEDSPYEIATVGELYYLTSKSDLWASGTYISVNKDIQVNVGTGNLADWDHTKQLLYPWESIGENTSGSYFQGIFDGNGNAISGLYSNVSVKYKAALFANVTSGCVKNLKIMDSHFETSAQNAGSVAGMLQATEDETASVENVYSNSAVVSAGGVQVGGILGAVAGKGTVTVSGCWFDGSVNSNSNYTGGIVGYINGTTNFESKTLINCLNTGAVTSTTTTDGMCGGLYGGTPNGTNFTVNVTNCLAMGKVKADAVKQVGTIVGFARTKYTVFTNVYTTNDIDLSVTLDSGYVGVGKTANNVSGSTVLVYDEAGVENSIIGSAAATTLSGFDFTGTDTTDPVWYAVEGSTPVLYIFRDLAK